MVVRPVWGVHDGTDTEQERGNNIKRGTSLKDDT